MSGTRGDGSIAVEVAYVEASRAVIVRLRVPCGATIEQVLQRAADCEEFKGIEVQRAAVGVFGRVVAVGRPVEEGDRVEIYRALATDPKAARRARAARKKCRG
jgi:hypothetical protein